MLSSARVNAPTVTRATAVRPLARVAPRPAAPAPRGRAVVRFAAVVAQAEPDAADAPAPAAPPADAPTPATPAASGAPVAPRFALTFLWLDKNVGVAVDALYGARSARSPLTEYYMWPRKDAWEELKTALEARPWVPERERVLLLNRATEVINFWQDEAAKHTVEDARAAFPDCTFTSS